ncbi:hypothetical protein QZH41_000248 [Actinostola sp. cb2023]|nr:hypothetical protein QZH41_000248 [Actinostola sp. cb2023]
MKELPEIRLEVTLAPATDVVVSYDPTKVGTYLLENIVLEYQTIEPDRSLDAIHIQRRSFVGLLGLFVIPHAAGARDTEAFQDPGISKVEFDIDGQSNVLYQHGMLPSDLWTSALSGVEWLLGASEKHAE